MKVQISLISLISVCLILFSNNISSAIFGSYEINQKPFIERLSVLYASAVDGRDFEELREVFDDSAVLEGPGFQFTGIEEIISGMEGLRQFDRTQHFVMNQNLRIENMNAVNEVYTIAYHFYKKDEKEHRLDWGIKYSDSLKRVKGKWKIFNRKLSLIWQKEEPI